MGGVDAAENVDGVGGGLACAGLRLENHVLRLAQRVDPRLGSVREGGEEGGGGGEGGERDLTGDAGGGGWRTLGSSRASRSPGPGCPASPLAGWSKKQYAC